MEKNEVLRRMKVIESKFTHRWDEMSEFARNADIEWIKGDTL